MYKKARRKVKNGVVPFAFAFLLLNLFFHRISVQHELSLQFQHSEKSAFFSLSPLLYVISPQYISADEIRYENSSAVKNISEIGERMGIIFPQERKTPPDFRIDERSLLSDLKGYIVLINFWSPRCLPCVEELPEIESIYRKLKDKNFVALGVYPDIDEEKVLSLKDKFGLTFPLVKDE